MPTEKKNKAIKPVFVIGVLVLIVALLLLAWLFLKPQPETQAPEPVWATTETETLSEEDTGWVPDAVIEGEGANGEADGKILEMKFGF